MERRWNDPPATLRQPGRKSAASLSVIAPDIAQQRPEPPSRLTAAEKRVWRETVERMRPGWFRGSENVLEMFCTSVVLERRLAGWIKELDDPKDFRYRDLIKMHKTEAMLVANLATRLRLTVRSTIDRYAPKLASPYPKPWDDKPPAA
jgi:hypothetical protein